MKNKIQNNLPKFIKTGLAVIATLVLTAIITDKVTDGAVGDFLANNAVKESHSYTMLSTTYIAYK